MEKIKEKIATNIIWGVSAIVGMYAASRAYAFGVTKYLDLIGKEDNQEELLDEKY